MGKCTVGNTVLKCGKCGVLEELETVQYSKGGTKEARRSNPEEMHRRRLTVFGCNSNADADATQMLMQGSDADATQMQMQGPAFQGRCTDCLWMQLIYARAPIDLFMMFRKKSPSNVHTTRFLLSISNLCFMP